MIYARNNQEPQPGAGFQEVFEYRLNEGSTALKLTVNVRVEEDKEGNFIQGGIILETTESPQYVWEDDEFSKQYLEPGFWSKSFATPITGWRIAVPENSELPGLVDFVAYG